MVDSHFRAKANFALFIIPAFVLYSLFFIVPFFRGFAISLTNWDGLTPRAPNVLSSTDFETKVLARLERPADREFLLSVYTLSDDGQTWTRRALSGFLNRRRAERVFSRAGFQSESNRYIGLKNYKDILSGNIGSSFYPRMYTQYYYNSTSALPALLDDPSFGTHFLSRLTSDERKVFDRYYQLSDGGYELIETDVEFYLEDLIWYLPEITDTETLSETDASDFIDAIRRSGVAQNHGEYQSVVEDFLGSHELSTQSRDAVHQAALGLYEVGDIKALLSSRWNSRKIDLGVIGFTLFFAFFSVIGINILAFVLALALDSGLRGQKALRSIFFLPNVLSMIIVALVWKMLFFQLFPRLTGVDQWLSDPAKTPSLIVLVAIWQGAGYYMIVYLAGLQNIPTDVLEAARIDGASAFQRFRSITLPLLVPAITISFFLTIANALKSFDLIYAITSGSAYTFGTVPVVLDIYFDAFARKQAGLATAKAMLLFSIIFLVTGIQLYVMKKKEVEQ